MAKPGLYDHFREGNRIFSPTQVSCMQVDNWLSIGTGVSLFLCENNYRIVSCSFILNNTFYLRLLYIHMTILNVKSFSLIKKTTIVPQLPQLLLETIARVIC